MTSIVEVLDEGKPEPQASATYSVQFRLLGFLQTSSEVARCSYEKKDLSSLSINASLFPGSV